MDKSQPPIRVVKIGGSLLEFDNTPNQLRRWLSIQTPMRTVWIVGGGKLVDEIRRLDEVHELDAMEVHQTCIDLMDLNSNRVSTWFPTWQITDDLDEFGQQRLPVNRLLTVSKWVKRNAQHLPASWDVTSDSIAATIAMAINAAELVLLKSGAAPPKPNVSTLIESNYVDGYFQEALVQAAMNQTLLANPLSGHDRESQCLLVRLVNLRTPEFGESVLQWPSTTDGRLHQLVEIEPPDVR